MEDKNVFWDLLAQGVRTLIVLFTLFLMSWFIGLLPYASTLPVLTAQVSATQFLDAVLSAIAIVVVIRFGREASPVVDRLLGFIPDAGRLTWYVIWLASFLFAYYAFQPVTFPFIRDFEWAYQSLFLGGTLFLLAKAGLHIYSASAQISAFVVSVLRPAADQPPAARDDVRAEP